MSKHEWYRNENGSIDIWRLDEGFHNGPECSLCYLVVCEHCSPNWKDLECEVASLQPKLPLGSS